MNFEVGQKLLIIESYYEYYVLLAKKGRTAIYKGSENRPVPGGRTSERMDFAIIELSNGATTRIPFDNIIPYEARKKPERIEDVSHEELLIRFAELYPSVLQMAVGVKANSKRAKELEKVKQEILHRMAGKRK